MLPCSAFLRTRPLRVPNSPSLTDVQAAARTLGLKLVVVDARTDSDLQTAFATFLQRHVGAVLVGPSAFFSRRTEQLVALAARHGLPAMFPYREYALAGGLMSYGSSFSYFYHQVGIYTGPHPEGRDACRFAGAAGY